VVVGANEERVRAAWVVGGSWFMVRGFFDGSSPLAFSMNYEL
jgi:hypothetical protein